MTEKTCLYQHHIDLGAKMVPFTGWLMPLHYGSQIEEHLSVRKQAGMFDVSHMGVFEVRGVDAESFLKYVVASDVGKLSVGQSQYSLLLNDRGGIKDDLIVYKVSDSRFILVVNAACAKKDWVHLTDVSCSFEVSLHGRDDWGMLAVSGPMAYKWCHAMLPEGFRGLPSFSVVPFEQGFIAKTGYTGELGFELILPQDQIIKYWQLFIDSGISPCGLGARDSLRLEAGMNLYGHEMDEDTLPWDSRVGWVVDMTGDRDFVGRDALILQPRSLAQYNIKGLIGRDRIMLRRGQAILDGHGQAIGHVTSGSFSPQLKSAIAMARVLAKSSKDCYVEIRGQKYRLDCVKLPLL